MSDSDLPVNKMDYVKLVSFCVSYGCLKFNDKQYIQHHGLAIGSPLSTVMASLFMESSEEGQFLFIMALPGSDTQMMC